MAQQRLSRTLHAPVAIRSQQQLGGRRHLAQNRACERVRDRFRGEAGIALALPKELGNPLGTRFLHRFGNGAEAGTIEDAPVVQAALPASAVLTSQATALRIEREARKLAG